MKRTEDVTAEDAESAEKKKEAQIK